MSTDINQLIRYSSALDNLAKHNSSDIFPNKNHKHASIVLSKILKYSKNDFILFDDDMKGDIVNHSEVESFKDSLIGFLGRGGRLKVVLSDKNTGDDKDLVGFMEILQELFKNQVSIKLATPEFKTAMKGIFNEKINFAIGDTNKFRLELFGDIPVDNKTREARGSFNNEKVVSQLLKVFNAYQKDCLEYFPKSSKV